MLKSNLRHQVRQTPLPKWKPWLPLFEALMNSFQAIREAKKPAGTGQILIEIEREHMLVDKGGKCLGRFTWLKSFERGEVDTTINAHESGTPLRRQFVFDEHYEPEKA